MQIRILIITQILENGCNRSQICSSEVPYNADNGQRRRRRQRSRRRQRRDADNKVTQQPTGQEAQEAMVQMTR